ncbi:hypothetical protein Taro_048609 [Colocasia esculenta]|uniref:Uncharacterized protein n=1 Tax=Colocasia esculenta TaxID=4460 RepID=A0A843X8J9_COLES|nr:hypothetical protein [Colocasia esculenta]
MRPFTDQVKVPILNWGLAGGSDPRANKYPRPTGGLGPRSRRGIWAPDQKSPNATIYRPGQSAYSELGPRGRFRPPGE